MNTVCIPNIDIEVWTYKSEFRQGILLRSLTQPEIIRQIPLELTDIYYYLTNDESVRMERVEYNTDAGRNVMNVDYIEDFESFSCHNM